MAAGQLAYEIRSHFLHRLCQIANVFSGVRWADVLVDDHLPGVEFLGIGAGAGVVVCLDVPVFRRGERISVFEGQLSLVYWLHV